MTHDGPKTILIRADASPSIGGGHVMRCLTLADVLTERGARVTFACRPETVATVPALTRSAHCVAELTGASEDEPKQMAAACDGAADVLIIDHYGWGAEQERACRKFARRILVIDDLANRTHDCDLLLDQNLGRRAEDYHGLVPQHARLLIGPAYALLRPEFARARPAALARRAEGGPVRRILVSMGLTDAANATATALDALGGIADVASGAIEVRVVLGRAAPHLAAVEAKAAHMRQAGAKVTVLVEPADMAAEMTAADLCIGAGGSSSWERCCLGLPTVVVVVAENQRAGAEALEKAGAALSATSSVGRSISDQIGYLLKSVETRTEVVERAAAHVDGMGAPRAASAMVAQSHAAVTLRPLRASDADIVYAWQSTPGARRYFDNPAIPTLDEHARWIERRLAMPPNLTLIAQIGTRPVALIHLEPVSAASGDRPLRLSILVDPGSVGQGIGTRSLEALCVYVPDHELIADIRPENMASVRAFERAGFHLAGACYVRPVPSRERSVV